MQIAPEAIRQMVREVWDSILHLTIEPHVMSPPSLSRTLSATVHIGGVWAGAVSITCGPTLATIFAVRMLGTSEAMLAGDDVHDVLGELANMVGGNFKAILPDVGWLSLPTVVEGNDFAVYIPHTREVARLPFKCGEHFLSVSLNEKLAAA